MNDLEAAPHVIQTRDIHIIDGPFIFPLREAIVRADAERLVALVHNERDAVGLAIESTPRVALVDASVQTSNEHITAPVPTLSDLAVAPPAATPSTDATHGVSDEASTPAATPSTETPPAPYGTDAMGRPVRRYKGSNRPPHIWPEIWRALGPRARKRATDEYLQHFGSTKTQGR